MKFKKDWSLIQTTINEKTGKSFFGLAGHDGFLFHGLPKDVKVFRIDESRNEIFVIDEKTFTEIKQKKLLHENLFPYQKQYGDLEEFKHGPS